MHAAKAFGSLSVSTELTASAQTIDRLYQSRVYLDRLYPQTEFTSTEITGSPRLQHMSTTTHAHWRSARTCLFHDI